jgi:DNA-binding response OmpR family regulator
MLARPTRLELQKTSTLLVDDSQPSLELMSQMLMGFRVGNIKSCRSAAEAKDYVKKHKFDLIVVDADMPDEDGISLIRNLRFDNTHPNNTSPIILVSGITPVQRIMAGRDAGANIVVKKPIAPATLLRRIEWLARNNRDFITTPNYCGPDRRYKSTPLPEGMEERRADALAMIATPEREMSQDDIDSLFS